MANFQVDASQRVPIKIWTNGVPVEEQAAQQLRNVASQNAAHRNYDYQLIENALTPAVAWLLMSILGKADVIEYGTSPRYGWLTPKGYRLRDFMLGKTPDELVALACTWDQEQPHCGPYTCNCAPEGHIGDGKPCPNPFYHDVIPEAARAQSQ